ncbi:MAG TPA: ATP-binding protein [Candidatus Baltobacteraceae bacterium]|nr:ATP-binding protein [Candidatus Baltobacteraceae bacterium]
MSTEVRELSDDELRSRLACGEGERVEFKEHLTSEARKAVCALANDLGASGEPGLFFVGIDDQGKSVGSIVDDALLKNLAQIRTGGDLQPLPSISVRALSTDTGPCAIVIIEPTDDPPMRYHGRIWVRVGSTTQGASPQDERRLVERRRISNLPFDHTAAPGAVLDDLNILVFERDYLPAAYAPDVLERNGRTLEERLKALRLTTVGGRPSVGGVLVLCLEPRRFIPGAYIQFTRFAGTDILSPIIDQKELSGMLDDMVRSMLFLLRLNVTESLEVRPGERDRRVSSYPLIALQEIAINAIMHRAYDTSNAPVRISFFDNRVEISNPGGPFGQVTVANIGEPNMTDYRNPLVAEALKALGFAQRFGFGITAARAALRDNGNPPLEIKAQANSVSMILRPAK